MCGAWLYQAMAAAIAAEQERLRAEEPDVHHQRALPHHGDLEHQDEGRHQGDQLVAELRVLQKVHSSV